MKKLVIMHCIPGCGKSYTANELASQVEDTVIASADHFFDALPGGYRANWQVSLLGKAHGACMDCAKEAMENGTAQVIIDNTNLRMKDVLPYIKVGLENGYEVTVIEPSSPWWQDIRTDLLSGSLEDEIVDEWAAFLEEKTTHGVPKETIARMLRQYKPYKVEELIESCK